MMCAPSNRSVAESDDEFHDAGGVFDGPAEGDVAVVLNLAGYVETLCHCLVLGQPDVGDLRIGEHRGGNVAMIGGDHRSGVVPVAEQVVLHDARFVVGDVLELVRRRHIAECEDVTGRGPLVFVDDDSPVVEFDAGLFGVQLIAVGAPAGGHQHDVGLQFGAVVEFEHDAGAVLVRAENVAVAAQFPFARRDAGESPATGCRPDAAAASHRGSPS